MAEGDSSVERITPGPVDVGTVWEITAEYEGQQIVVHVEVTAHEPDTRVGFITTTGPVDAQLEFTLQPSC